MSTESPASEASAPQPRRRMVSPLQFVLRGLAISLPSVVTVVILLWVARGINTYIVYPATSAMKWVLAQGLDNSTPVEGLVKVSGGPPLEHCGQGYLVTRDLQAQYLQEVAQRSTLGAAAQEPLSDWLERQPGVFVPFGESAVPYEDYLVVARNTHPLDMPRTTVGLYMDYAAERYIGSLLHLSLLAIILILVGLYFLGRFVTARIGHWLLNRFENGVLGRLPLIRNVYGSVKQVTEFLFSENQVQYRRVVAIEYPRRGIWSLGLVTNDSMLDITTAVGEPCVTVLVPSSPMPVTGYTMSLPRSHVLDLNITVDQAMSFCISCGVLVPPHQKVTPELLRQHFERRLAEGFQTSATSRVQPVNPNPLTSAAGGAGFPSGSGVVRPGGPFGAAVDDETNPPSPSNRPVP